ncbi:MAG TPA: hypothetical protein PKB06_05810 [Actinotalea sp.]|nr:hypothetical protein [Actinotalea sp.]
MVARNRVALGLFTDLRNVLSHRRYVHGEPIATPLAATVAAIERLRDEIVSPKPALSFAARTVMTATPVAPLAEVLAQMAVADISQVPVAHPDGRVDLLTTNAIARWVADHLEPDGSVLIQASRTSDALRYSEGHERVKLVKRTATVAAVLDLLTRTDPPTAVLITEAGRGTAQPLGILWASGHPKLVAAVTVEAY